MRLLSGKQSKIHLDLICNKGALTPLFCIFQEQRNRLTQLLLSVSATVAGPLRLKQAR